ncbi:hypothetical protein DICVIV_09616 [Dictyocaulus viviparus]|uniref:Piezo TM1-24 domain-containing protein n=1 Tax=Dictyocaulus viviparus TaxID=29172 RepID=A0A0D8XKP2_DICVI|nr:hypothetical protein DICVIV_09616 [Dictyocaulus viviparus]
MNNRKPRTIIPNPTLLYLHWKRPKRKAIVQNSATTVFTSVVCSHNSDCTRATQVIHRLMKKSWRVSDSVKDFILYINDLSLMWNPDVLEEAIYLKRLRGGYSLGVPNFDAYSKLNKLPHLNRKLSAMMFHYNRNFALRKARCSAHRSELSPQTAFIRPCFISAGYLVFALLSSLLPNIHPALPLPASIRLYSWLCVFYCLLATLGMVIYQIYEAVTFPDEQQYIKMCNETRIQWLRNIGFIRLVVLAYDSRIDTYSVCRTRNQFFKRFHGGDGIHSAVTIFPEIVAFISSLASSILVVIVSHRNQEVYVAGTVKPVRMNSNGATDGGLCAQSLMIALKRFSNFAVIVFAAFVGCVQILLFFSAFHILTIYTYQIPIIQELLPGESLPARIIGLYPILLTECQRWWIFWLNETLQLPAMINPIILLVFYHVLMVQLLWTYHGSRSYVDDTDGGSSIHEERLYAGNNVDVNDASSPRGNLPLLPFEGEANSTEAGQSIPLQKITSQIVDRHKIGQIFGTAENPTTIAASRGMVAIFSFALYHAYTLALLAMMTWALLYHSIFGLILLVLACTLWMFKDSRGASFAMAPSITVYIEFLLLAQYVCSMNVTPAEIHIPDFLKMIGFALADNMWSAFVTLFTKLLLSFPVFLLFRLSVREHFYESLSDHERARHIQNYGTFTAGDTGALVSRTAAGFPDIWTSWTGLNEKWNNDIGLINYNNAGESGTLFVRLFTPISLLVVAMLQLKFFHEPWIAMVRGNSRDPNEAVLPEAVYANI